MWSGVVSTLTGLDELVHWDSNGALTRCQWLEPVSGIQNAPRKRSFTRTMPANNTIHYFLGGSFSQGTHRAVCSIAGSSRRLFTARDWASFFSTADNTTSRLRPNGRVCTRSTTLHGTVHSRHRNSSGWGHLLHCGRSTYGTSGKIGVKRRVNDVHFKSFQNVLYCSGCQYISSIRIMPCANQDVYLTSSLSLANTIVS